MQESERRSRSQLGGINRPLALEKQNKSYGSEMKSNSPAEEELVRALSNTRSKL